MAIQTINLGNTPNDGLGDDLRAAFLKVNANFQSLEAELSIVGENIGNSGVGIYKQKVGANLQLKKIAAGDSTVVVVDDTVNNTVKITAPLQNTFSSIIVNGAYTATSPTDSISFINGDNINITRVGSQITISSSLISGSLDRDLDINNFDIIGSGNININGNISATNYNGLVYNTDAREHEKAVFDFDFGKIIPGSYTNVTEFLFSVGDYDFGSIASPSDIDLDLGTI